MAASLLNKGLDFLFAIVVVRTLGPADLGQYTWAVLVVGYFDIAINFGLGVLITRDVARDPPAANRYLGGALAARVVLWLLAGVAALAMGGPLAAGLGLTPEMSIALGLLTLGIGVSNLSGLLSALLNAREQMEYPAAITVFTTVLKVVLGVAALVAGWGFVGLAAISVVVNALTAGALLGLFARVAGWPHPMLDVRFSAQLLATSYPLMINNLLATVFFRIDGLLLRAAGGDAVLGWYTTAYKFIDGLNVIPSSVTLALFPALSRMYGDSSARLVRATELAMKGLLGLAVPIAVGTSLLADPLIRAFAGEAYLPHAAIALQLLIWLLPLSFVNGLLQYVLIAVDQQRFITLSFLGAAAFNVGANLLLIPTWSYAGAAVVTVASELVLLGPFWFAVQRHVGPVRLLALAWRPALAGLAMAPVVWLLREPAALLAVPIGALVYAGALLAIGGIREDERAILTEMLHPSDRLDTTGPD